MVMVMQIQGMPNLTTIIERSLQRSALYGVDPHQLCAPESSKLTADQLAHRIEKQRDFYTMAREQLDNLYRLLQDTGFCMALADKDGYVLHVIGDSDLVEHFKRRNCTPGYRWTEKDIGTCVIGLVLEEEIPIFLHGDQMFATLAQKISNAGAPIFSPDGTELLGVVSLSGYSENMHIHTLGLVRLSAETVTAQLREAAHNRKLAIQNQYMNALLASTARGMITVNQKALIVQANRKAQKLLQLPSDFENKSFSQCVGEGLSVAEYLRTGKGFTSREFVSSVGGATHFASLDPIRLDTGELVGGLITVIEKKEFVQFAVEMTGSHAHFTFDTIIGNSDKLLEAVHMAKIAASSSTTVLLCGETGTGKEVFAQAIHNASDRAGSPFVAINCGAIPKELLESELFGYEEGSFTGAQKGGRPGKLELADNGTLFLDEIGDMPFDMQVKLLRVLQTGEIQRVGGLRSIPVNLRVISATNRDLKQAIEDHKFRDDLYYRICTLKITIPPLRDRDNDILELTDHFIRRHEIQLNRQFFLKKQETVQALQQYRWPGNIRQLESAVERAVHLCEHEILLPEHFGISEMLGEQVDDDAVSSFHHKTLAEIERLTIWQALDEFGGNICKTAQALGISRPTIYRKIEKYDIKMPQAK